MESFNTLIALGLAMFAGLIMTRLMKKINLPNVTGFLIAGIIIGPFCLKVFSQDALPELNIITNAALGFIAFSIGGEFKSSALKAVGSKIFIITLFEAVGASVIVIAALLAFSFPVPLALVLGAIASATAPAATLMVVRQYKAKGPITQTLLPVVALDDAVCLMLFSILSSIANVLEAGNGFSVYGTLIKPILQIVLSMLLGIALGMVLSVCIKYFKSRANRSSLIVMIVFLGVGLSDMLGFSSLLVCMGIGAALANISPESDAVMDISDRWTSPIFMLFFVISGAGLDISILPKIGLVGIIYVLARSFGKYFGAGIGCRIVKSPKTVSKYLGITLLPQAGVAIGMAQLSMTVIPQYGETIRAVILCGTLIYELIGPLLTKIVLKKAGEISK
ncbi:MAG: cation:proton antiporter [Oscillospiraceae bacterium]